MARMLATIAVVLALLAAALIGLLWWSQERIVFQPPAFVQREEDAERRIDYTSADGQRLFGFVAGDPGAATGLLIAFHGNADVAVRQLPWAHGVHGRTGWAVLLAEYRGYDGLDGRPTAAGVRLDARAAHDAAVETLGIDPAHIAFYGHSLGTPIAVELAAELAAELTSGTAAQVEGMAAPVHALLLESPFTSARDMASTIGAYGALLFVGRLSRFHWDTEARVRELAVPVAVVHGAQDVIVPVHMGRRVHAAAAVPGPLLIVPGAGHNDIASHAGEEYWRWMKRALMRP